MDEMQFFFRRFYISVTDLKRGSSPWLELSIPTENDFAVYVVMLRGPLNKV
jgi:hypothetical protein